MRAIGDLASFISTKRFQSDLSQSANTSAQAATTGLVSDKARHLGGATMALSLLERKSTLLHQQKLNISEAAVFATATQVSLGHIQENIETLTSDLSLTSQLASTSELQTLSNKALESFLITVSTMNTKISGRHFFSGSATDTMPLPDGNVLLDWLRASITGATTANDVITAIDTWFDAPGGVYETGIYQGSDTGFLTLPLDAQASITFGLRADGNVVRDSLKALAKAALASDPTLTLSLDDRKELQIQSRVELLTVNQSLIEERSNVGLAEAAIKDAGTRSETEIARLDAYRLSLIATDQFEEISKFEMAQQQLEIFYRVAARQSQTSLAEYLR
ncbi:hypothetical protein [Marivita sp. S2033]|uniref:hypothetical protein n=1 Tax=Marivita sp. S2033 TaxID=3373187 RepID=UPI0039829F20